MFNLVMHKVTTGCWRVKKLCFAHTVYLRPQEPKSTPRLFPWIPSTFWLLMGEDCVLSEVRSEVSWIICVSQQTLQCTLIFIVLILHVSCYQEDWRAKPGNFPKSNAVWEIGELWTRKDFHISFVVPNTVPWLTRLVDRLSPRRRGFHHRPVPVRFVVDKVDMGRGFIRGLWFSPVSITLQNAPFPQSCC